MPLSLHSEKDDLGLPMVPCDPGYRWVDSSTAARIFNRTPMTINRWCKNGMLVSVGCKVRQDLSRRWYVMVFVGKT